MRSIVVLGWWAFIVWGVAMSPAHAQLNSSDTTQNCVGKANSEKLSAYVVLLRLRGDIYAKWKETGVWAADAQSERALAGHSKYWAKQLKDGHAIVAGAMDGDYWDNVALIVFEAASQEEAETIARGDPAVNAHVFQAQVRPFNVFWLTNKFDASTHVCDEVQPVTK